METEEAAASKQAAASEESNVAETVEEAAILESEDEDVPATERSGDADVPTDGGGDGAQASRRSRVRNAQFNERRYRPVDEEPMLKKMSQVRGAPGPEVRDIALTKAHAMISMKTFAEVSSRYVTVYTKARVYNPLCRVGC